MRSAEAQALASSVQSDGTDDQNDGVSSWHKMGTAVSQRLPRMMKRGGDSNKEALVKGKKKTKARKSKGKAAGEESIYDQDDLDGDWCACVVSAGMLLQHSTSGQEGPSFGIWRYVPVG